MSLLIILLCPLFRNYVEQPFRCTPLKHSTTGDNPDMADHAKQQRTTAKGLLTKAIKRVIKAIDEKLSKDIIQNRFSEANKQWLNLLERNESYLQLAYPDEDVPEAENEWLEIVTEQYDKMEIEIDKTMKQQPIAAKPVEEETHINANRIYQFEEKTLTSMIKELHIISDDTESTAQTIKDYQVDLKKQFYRFQDAQRELAVLGIPVGDSSETNSDFTRVNIKAGRRIEKSMEKFQPKSSGSQVAGPKLKMETLKMPSFSGNILDYMRFKEDFQRQVAPNMEKESLSYALKSCLSGQASDVVRNVDNSIKDMWSRLDDRFGRISKITDAIMYKIKKIKPIQEGDDRKFTEMVDMIEGSFRDLKRIDMQGELSNSSVSSRHDRRETAKVRQNTMVFGNL